MSKLIEELRAVLNRESAENASNTPDFILAVFLKDCLSAFDTAIQQREAWYGRDGRPSAKKNRTEEEARKLIEEFDNLCIVAVWNCNQGEIIKRLMGKEW